MRLLFLTDTHIRGTTPKNRIDDITLTLMDKIKEIVKIVENYNIDFVLHGGDLFDRPDTSVSIVSSFASILNDIKVPIYIVCGNHDIYGHNPDTVNRTMLGLLDSLNIIHIVNKDSKIFLEKDGVRVQLTGYPYTYDIDSKSSKDGYIVKDVSPDIDYALHMVHGMLLDRSFIKGVPYTLIDEIKSTKADITLSGHYHSGFGIINAHEKYFINPGSLMRITNSLSEVKRMPKVAMIDLGNTVDIKLIELDTALKGEEVLDREEIQNYTFRSERLLDFKQSIDNAINFKKLEINEILIEISNVEEISREVKEEALKRISLSQIKNARVEL